MNDLGFTFIVIPLFVLAMMGLGKYIRKKLAKPQYENNVQTPGGLDRFILNFITVLTVLSAILSLVGLLISETEMALVFLVITIIFLICVLILRNAYNMSYLETEDYFILNIKNKEYKVYYDDIIDWQGAFNEIWIFDKSRTDNKPVKVNISIFKPEILLQKIVDMTFEGKFYEAANIELQDPYRKNELIGHFTQYNYRYLVEDYID